MLVAFIKIFISSLSSTDTLILPTGGVGGMNTHIDIVLCLCVSKYILNIE